MTPTMFDKIRYWFKYRNGYFKFAFIINCFSILICSALCTWHKYNNNIFEFIWYALGSFFFLTTLFFIIVLRIMRVQYKNLERDIEKCTNFVRDIKIRNAIKDYPNETNN